MYLSILEGPRPVTNVFSQLNSYTFFYNTSLIFFFSLKFLLDPIPVDLVVKVHSKATYPVLVLRTLSWLGYHQIHTLTVDILRITSNLDGVPLYTSIFPFYYYFDIGLNSPKYRAMFSCTPRPSLHPHLQKLNQDHISCYFMRHDMILPVAADQSPSMNKPFIQHTIILTIRDNSSQPSNCRQWGCRLLLGARWECGKSCGMI